MTTEAYLKTSKEAGITTIEFFHPAQNSLPSDMLANIAQAVEQSGADVDTKVVVLKSGGDRTFCAGASFTELLTIEDAAQGEAFFSGFANVINAIRLCPKFVIVRVQGKAVGGGVGLAAAADYCMATGHASIKLSELAIGIGPFVIGPVVERKLGLSRMSQLAMDAESFYDAKWAMDKGLYHNVFEDAGSLDCAIESLARRLAAYNPDAMQELKRVFWQGTDHWPTLLAERARLSGRLILSEFTREKLAKYSKPS